MQAAGLSHKKTVVVIAGPTAVGKTAAAITVARQLGTEIISADSRQCYKELSIGVARPSKQELKEIPHHFIATHSVTEEVTAAAFEQYALKKVDELFRLYDRVVMTGGTGLYIKAFCEGLDTIPDVHASIRETIIAGYDTKGLEWLQLQVQQKDPLFFEKGEIKNPQRLMRALEVVEATGQSILHFRKNEKAQRDFNVIKIGLELPREELNAHINRRVDAMMEAGLLNEVKALLPYKQLNALQTVGYKELFDYLENITSLEEAVELIKKHTRQYAKRQMTWFKKDPAFSWMPASEVMEGKWRIISGE